MGGRRLRFRYLARGKGKDVKNSDYGVTFRFTEVWTLNLDPEFRIPDDG
jgi:hypothetical protein